MSREKFIEEIEAILKTSDKKLSTDASEFYDLIKSDLLPKADAKNPDGITDRGKTILAALQANSANDTSAIFTSKRIGEITGLATRSVTGSIRGLVSRGYVTKVSVEPVTYALTELGRDIKFE